MGDGGQVLCSWLFCRCHYSGLCASFDGAVVEVMVVLSRRSGKKRNDIVFLFIYKKSYV